MVTLGGHGLRVVKLHDGGCRAPKGPQRGEHKTVAVLTH